MIYQLPNGPTITLVGPDNTAWWAALGVDPAGRHALVIGDPAPAPGVVVAGRLPELTTYLDPVQGPLARTLAEVYDQAQHVLRRDGHREDPTPAPSPPPAEPEPDVDVVTLPHTGIRVPDLHLRVTSLRELPTPDGVAYTATLRQGPTPVGTIFNEGVGGQTGYHPAAGSPFGHRQLAAVVVASRDADGQPMDEEQLLEALVTEYENAEHVAAAARTGRSPVRLMAPIGAGNGPADMYGTVYRTTAAKITTAAQRDALIAVLQHREVVDGAWWQLWTGQRWEDLTAPPQPAAGKENVS